MQSINIQKSDMLFKKAKKVIPGGVNSPVRAFNSVGSIPRFIKRAKGQYLFDEDENTYIDYIGSWGPMILGHNPQVIKEQVLKAIENGLSFGATTKLELEIADFICQNMPCVEMVRMVNSGTEAVMSAIRLARGYTGKSKIIKFAGCYHGHADCMLVKAGSGVMTSGIADSLGVPKDCAKDTLTAIYNDFSSVEKLFKENKGEIACLIIEPVAANMGVVLPQADFLNKIRQICTNEKAVLIFDEVITGFRLGFTGAAGYFNIQPDLITYGKIIGGGMPVGAYGGKREIMEFVSPVGQVYQAGTLSGNPIAMTAGLAQLKYLEEHLEVYNYIDELSNTFRLEAKEIFKNYHIPVCITGIGSLSCIYFNENEVTNYNIAKLSDTNKFAKYFNFMLNRGNYFGASQFEAIFISYAHKKEDINYTLQCISDFLEKEKSNYEKV